MATEPSIEASEDAGDAIVCSGCGRRLAGGSRRRIDGVVAASRCRACAAGGEGAPAR